MNDEQLIDFYISEVKQIFEKIRNQQYLTKNKDFVFEIFHYSLKICHKIDNLKVKNLLNKNYNKIYLNFKNFADNYCNYNNFMCKKVLSEDDIQTKQCLKEKFFQSFCNLEQNINEIFSNLAQCQER